MKHFFKFLFPVILGGCNNGPSQPMVTTIIDSSSTEQQLRKQTSDEAAPAYKLAWKEIQEFKINIDLAKDNTDRRNVINQYNSGPG